MAVLTRITDFIPNTLIESQEVDDEFNQLVNILSGVSTNKDALIKYSHSTDPVLRVDQLGAGVIQQWLQNGSVKTVIKGNGQIVGYPRTIHVNTTATGNVGAGTDSLHSFTLPAGSLAADGDFVEVKYGGTYPNSNNNSKQIIVSIDGQTVYDSGARDIDNVFAWWIRFVYTRISATSVRASGQACLGRVLSGTDGALDTGNSRWEYQARNATPTVANLTSNGVVLLVQAVATTDNDVTQNSSHISLTQMA